jgi:CHAT domain-containing protein
VEWAVLSACETGRGVVAAGEGVLGLRRAFRLAGVDALVVSLWPVEDQSTTALMRELYANRARGASIADAVVDAQRARLAAARAAGRSTHPFSWGAFVATGAGN